MAKHPIGQRRQNGPHPGAHASLLALVPTQGGGVEGLCPLQ